MIIPIVSPVIIAIIGTEEQPEQIAFLFKINNLYKRTSSDEIAVFIVCYVNLPLFFINIEVTA